MIRIYPATSAYIVDDEFFTCTLDSPSALTTNDGATSLLTYADGGDNMSGTVAWEYPALGVPAPTRAWLRVAADFTGPFAYLSARLLTDTASPITGGGTGSSADIAILDTGQADPAYVGLDQPGYVEKDYELFLELTDESLRLALNDEYSPFSHLWLMLDPNMSGETPGGSHALTITYVALVLEFPAALGRQYPRDDIGRQWPHPRSVQSTGRVGWSHYN